MNKIFILLLIGISFIDCYEVNVSFVAVVSRNAQRTPLKANFLSFYNGNGFVTPTGMKHSFDLGKWLVERYQDLFVNINLTQSQIYLRSADTVRAIMTSKALLGGMFNRESVIQNKPLLRKKVKIYTTAEDQDHIMSDKVPCKEYNKELNNYKNNENHHDILQYYKELFKYLTSSTGQPINEFEEIKDIYKSLQAEESISYKIPFWANNIYPKVIEAPTSYGYRLPTYNNKLARLKVGPLLNDIIDEMKKKAASISDRKISIYAGHSETIANILNGLHIYTMHCPEYLATVLLELIYDNNTESYSVRVLYKKNINDKTPRLMYIPKCGHVCPLDKFININKPILPEDWKSECDGTHVMSIKYLKDWILLYLLLLIVIILIDIISDLPTLISRRLLMEYLQRLRLNFTKKMYIVLKENRSVFLYGTRNFYNNCYGFKCNFKEMLKMLKKLKKGHVYVTAWW